MVWCLANTNQIQDVLKYLERSYPEKICSLPPDDGKLSFDEFKSYFSDGVLTAEELKELFHTIDTHNTE